MENQIQTTQSSMVTNERVYSSLGHLQNGIEVYANGVVVQGSETLAYRNGGSASDYAIEVQVEKGSSMVFDVTPSYNSICDRVLIKVFHHADGSIEVIECDEEEDERVTFVTQNTEVRAGGRLFIWYYYFNESRDYIPGTLTQSVGEFFSDEKCKDLTADSYEAMERAVDDVLEGYSE